jgi:hypothetical protein
MKKIKMIRVASMGMHIFVLMSQYVFGQRQIVDYGYLVGIIKQNPLVSKIVLIIQSVINKKN